MHLILYRYVVTRWPFSSHLVRNRHISSCLSLLVHIYLVLQSILLLSSFCSIEVFVDVGEERLIVSFPILVVCKMRR